MYKGEFASELSMNEVKEYYDELRENYPRTEEQWADFNILQEKLIVFAYKILDGKTNGDVIKAMFPEATISKIKSKTEQTKIAVEWHFEDIPFYYNLFYEDWWNAPYKAERRESEN